MKTMAMHVTVHHDPKVPRDKVADVVFDALRAIPSLGEVEVNFINRGQMATYTRPYENSTRVG